MEEIEIKKIIDHRESPCVSLITSTEYKSFLDRDTLRIKFKNHISEIKERLEAENYDDEVIQKVLASIKNLMKQVSFGYLQKGVGIYVSPSFTKLVSFSFPVSDKLSIANHFLLSDIEKLDKEQIGYLALLLSKKECRLFEGFNHTMNEIDDANFPYLFKDEFQAQRSSPHSLYNNEESKIDHSRVENYFRKIDKLVQNEYSRQPIILLGVVENISLFKSISKMSNSVIGEIIGNFDKKIPHDISQLVLPEIENYINQSENKTY